MKRTLAILLMLCLLPISGVCDTNHATYYEIFVGAFYDSDGDGMGDLQGILKKLDYLNDGDDTTDEDLSITGIWLMPIMPSPSYHKYDVTDYFAVDPAYGTLADFQALADACHRRDIKLIIDGVFNHSSTQHPWFQSAVKSLNIAPCGEVKCTSTPLCRAHNPYVDYYVFNQQSIGSAVAGASGWYYEALFGGHMPDLNLDNEALREELLAIGDFWFQQGADGFRLDAVTYYYGQNTAQNKAFLQWLTQGYQAINPGMYLVAEAWTDANIITDLAASTIPSLFAFPFAGPTGHIVDCIRNKNGIGLSTRLETYQNALTASNPASIPAFFLSNHDMARSAGTLMKNLKKEKLACAITLLMPGNSFIYYGDELGQLGSGRDENKRQPFFWSATDSTGICNPPLGTDSIQPIALGFAQQTSDPDSLLSFYRQAIRLKEQFPALSSGKSTAIDTGIKAICAYQVSTEGAPALTVMHNLSDKVQALPSITGTLEGSLDAGGESPTLAGDTLTLPPYATVIVCPGDVSPLGTRGKGFHPLG